MNSAEKVTSMASGSPHVFDVHAEEFAEKVLAKSHEIPVLVDFWAVWCQPCQMLGPILEKLADSHQGRLLVAKVNTDEERSLASEFGIRSLPTLKLFSKGQVVEEIIGVQPESALESILARHLPRASDANREQALALRAAGNLPAAVALLREAAATDPGNTRLQVDLAAALIDSGELDAAEKILKDLPLGEHDTPRVNALLGYLNLSRQTGENAGADTQTLLERVSLNPDDLPARLSLGARKALEGDYTGAMDQYLEVLKRNRNFGDDAGRKGLLEVFRIMGEDDPRVSDYRRRMARLLN